MDALDIPTELVFRTDAVMMDFGRGLEYVDLTTPIHDSLLSQQKHGL